MHGYLDMCSRLLTDRRPAGMVHILDADWRPAFRVAAYPGYKANRREDPPELPWQFELIDERLYHLDLTFCPLDERRAIVAPLGWDRYGCEVVKALVPEPLALDIDESLTPIPADPELLHRALSNLVLNAMDAMPGGGTLTMRSRKSDNGARIEIADTGSGLTPEECERIFTPYYTSKQHGTGLGLAIVQSVVSDHQGTINVHSDPGNGTIFVIELPKNPEPSQTAGAP